MATKSSAYFQRIKPKTQTKKKLVNVGPGDMSGPAVGHAVKRKRKRKPPAGGPLHTFDPYK